ncbi:MAG: hypothetical protein K2F65_06915, partial [Eubacterium sp.]|nr:hypothetical protein [Eubacterium sp.]
DTSLDVPLNVRGVGFAYQLSNDSISKIVPGVLGSGTLSTVDASGKVTGLISEKILISDKLTSVSNIENVVLHTSGSATPIVVPFSSITTKDANGNYVLDKNAWKASGELLSFDVNFKSFASNIKMDDDIFVAVEGYGNIPGGTTKPIKITSTFETDYVDEELNKKSTDPAQLVVKQTNPKVTAYGYHKDNSTIKSNATSQEVPVEVNGVGFAYQLSNDSDSLMLPGVFDSGSFASVSSGDVVGLIADKILISEDLVSVSDINSVSLYTSTNPTTPINVPLSSFTQDANGNYVLDASAWNSGGGQLLKFVVNFDTFDEKVKPSSDIFIAVEGYANIPGGTIKPIEITSSFATDYTDAVLNKKSTDKAKLIVKQANPVVKAYSYNSNGTYSYHDTSLTVPLDVEGIGYRYVLSNNSVSIIKPGKFLSGTFATVSGSKVTGLISNEIFIAKNVVDISDISAILLYTSGSTTPITLSLSDFTQDANGNYVLTKEDGWASSGELLRFEVHFNSFDSGIAQDFNNNYIYVKGYANVAKQITATASFTTAYKDTSLNLTATDAATLNVQRAVPAIVTDVFNYNPTPAQYGDPYTV